METSGADREVLLNQREASLQDRPGSQGIPVVTLARGARLHVLGTVEEDGETWMQVRQPSGRVGFLPGKTRVKDLQELGLPAGSLGRPRATPTGARAGIAMMVIAAVWFFLGWRAGRIFFYPPVLFVIGLVALVRGLAADAKSGTAADHGVRWSPPKRRTLVVLGVLLVAAVGFGLWNRRAADRVWLVNGLDVGVDVTLQGRTLRLYPGVFEGHRFEPGRHRLVAKTTSGETVEELDVEVPADDSFALYSVLGAAPVHVEDVVYTTSKVVEEGPPADESLAGTSWQVRAAVHHPFEAAPATVQMMQSKRMVRRRAFLSNGGWRAAVAETLGGADPSRGVDLAHRVASLQRDEAAMEFALGVAASAGADRLMPLAESMVARAPESIAAHRAYQTALEMLGRKAEALPSYRAAYEKDPSSPKNGYLYARLLPPREAIPILERLVLDHPEDPWIRRSAGWNFLATRKFGLAAAQFESLASVDPVMARGLLGERARALVGAGRAREAQRLLVDALEPGSWGLLILYAKIVRLPDADPSLPAPSNVVRKVADTGDSLDVYRAQVAAFSRDPEEYERRAPAITESSVREACRLVLLSTSDVEAAAVAAKKASEKGIAHVDDPARVAIVCELLRAGDEDLARAVYGQGMTSGWRIRFEALSDPAALTRDESLDADLDVRAVLALAAARRATSAEERETLTATARELDVLRCLVPR